MIYSAEPKGEAINITSRKQEFKATGTGDDAKPVCVSNLNSPLNSLQPRVRAVQGAILTADTSRRHLRGNLRTNPWQSS